MLLLVIFVYVYIYNFYLYFFFFKQKTAYEMRISDWSSDVCSSDLTFAFLQCGENVGLGRDLAEMRRSDLLLALADEHDVDGQLAPRGADRVERGEESRLGPLLVHRAAAHDRDRKSTRLNSSH